MKHILWRLIWAAAGLFVCAAGLYLTIQAGVGLGPWDALNMGLSYHLPISYGTASVLLGLLIVGVDVLMHERIGAGTLMDALLVGKFVDLLGLLGLVPAAVSPVWGYALLVLGMVLVSIGQWLYMSAGLCCGPRDALLVGLGRRVPKMPIGVVTGVLFLAVTILALGLGGPVGIGTLLYVVGQSAIMQLVFHIARFEPRDTVHEDLVQTLRHFTMKEERV